MSPRYLTESALRDLQARLTPRDLDVLKRVSDLRFVSGSQLTRLHYTDSSDMAASGRAARRALLRLTRLELLTRLPRPIGGVRSGSAGFVYYLGLAGQHLAASYGWQPERRRRRSLVPGTLFLRHTLAVAELHIRLVEADRSRSVELLELSAEPSCWRSYDGIGSQRLTLKPDSYVRLGVGPYEDSYFIEVDRGTEGSRAIEQQLRLYLAYYRSAQEQTGHDVFPRVLWLAPTTERAAIIEDCVQGLPTGSQALFQAAEFEAGIRLITGPNAVE